MPRFFISKNATEKSLMNDLSHYLMNFSGQVTTNESYDVITEQLYSFFPNSIYKDISKITFDLENFTFGDFDDHLKFETLENGLSVFWCCAGGDWETPVHFIIYHDGQRFRGYVPTNGNTFHKKSKCAYGSIPEEYNIEDEVGPEPNYNLMKEDIINRIKFKEGYVASSKQESKPIKEDLTFFKIKRKIKLD